MDVSLTALLHSAGLDAFLPLLLALHATASALDALIPQPVPGSHWLVLRKLLSMAAGNVFNATNADQPALITWFQRIAEMLIRVLPPVPAATAQPAMAPITAAQQPPAVQPSGRIEPAVAPQVVLPASLFPPVVVNPQP